ncbi:MAG TPA: FUSC family protein [Bryobacteraceae bacterium]|nr:FUSC family protein [Bryobacteraceae bacterium]
MTFWHGLIRYDAQKVNPSVAVRNAIGVGIPLAVGVLLGRPAGGLLAAIGALNVAYSDGSDPYQFRARRMISASILVAGAVFAGGLAGASTPTRLAVSALCAFAAGMMVAVGQIATDIGNIVLVTIIVFSAHSMAPPDAALSGLAALGGALFQTGLAVAWWPVGRYAPQRRALASFYRELERTAALASSATVPSVEAPLLSSESTYLQTALSSQGADGSLEVARYLMLLSQAERIRLSLLALSRVRIRLTRDNAHEEAARIDRALARTAAVLGEVAAAIAAERQAPPVHLSMLPPDGGNPDIDALAGQLRSAAELAEHSTPAGLLKFARQQSSQPWTLRVGSALAAIRANLSWQSGAFRHALRLAIVVPAAELLTAAVGSPRGYWAAMTAAIVLRPDFAGTFTRSLLRIAGTLAGLGLATALFHFLNPPLGWQVALLTGMAFVLRCWGPANYGIFAVALTGLIVLLLAATGVAPGTVIVARGINTVVGGALGLVAYWLWPTWERSQIGDVLANLLEAYRAYFRAVGEAYLDGPDASRLDRKRLAARLARSSLEASVGRLHGEPGVAPRHLTWLDATGANSLRFIHAAMALEAGLYRSRPVPARPPFRPFMEHVDLTLHYLAAVLRGSAVPADHLPDLRHDHRLLVEAGTGEERYALVDVETDRITNSVNTLAKEILEWRPGTS